MGGFVTNPLKKLIDPPSLESVLTDLHTIDIAFDRTLVFPEIDASAVPAGDRARPAKKYRTCASQCYHGASAPPIARTMGFCPKEDYCSVLYV
jgi:hypothetical protein